jgi:hypothetical protein
MNRCEVGQPFNFLMAYYHLANCGKKLNHQGVEALRLNFLNFLKVTTITQADGEFL